MSLFVCLSILYEGVFSETASHCYVYIICPPFFLPNVKYARALHSNTRVCFALCVRVQLRRGFRTLVLILIHTHTMLVSHSKERFPIFLDNCVILYIPQGFLITRHRLNHSVCVCVCVCVCLCVCLCVCVCVCGVAILYRVTGGELFDEIVAREYYSETDAR